MAGPLARVVDPATSATPYSDAESHFLPPVPALKVTSDDVDRGFPSRVWRTSWG